MEKNTKIFIRCKLRKLLYYQKGAIVMKAMHHFAEKIKVFAGMD